MDEENLLSENTSSQRARLHRTSGKKKLGKKQFSSIFKMHQNGMTKITFWFPTHFHPIFESKLTKSSAVLQIVVKKENEETQITKYLQIYLILNLTLQFTSTPTPVIASKTYEAFAFAFPLLNAAQGGTKSRRAAAHYCMLLHQNLEDNEKQLLFCSVIWKKCTHTLQSKTSQHKGNKALNVSNSNGFRTIHFQQVLLKLWNGKQQEHSHIPKSRVYQLGSTHFSQSPLHTVNSRLLQYLDILNSYFWQNKLLYLLI